jgi:urease accessory protein
MTAAVWAQRPQRSEGAVALAVGRQGLRRLSEAGACKARLLPGAREAILINTGGGLAGGDRLSIAIDAEDETALTVTTQAAERVYRSDGAMAEVEVKLSAGMAAHLAWLPQETILFDGAALNRRIEVDISAATRFLALESFILGRAAMGETVRSGTCRDRWRVRREGVLVFAEELALDFPLAASPAILGTHLAFATLVYLGPDAEGRLAAARAAIGVSGGASAWSGKLIARIVAGDGFALRRVLISLLPVLAGGSGLPRIWSM